jgi:hypothetical protein
MMTGGSASVLLSGELGWIPVVTKGLVVIFPGGKCGGVHVGGHYQEPEQRQGS